MFLLIEFRNNAPGKRKFGQSTSGKGDMVDQRVSAAL